MSTLSLCINKEMTIYYYYYIKTKVLITTYAPVIWPKFKLPARGLKFDTLPI